MDRNTLTKQEIARGYDAIVDKVGLESRFYDECLAMWRSYRGAILDIGCGRGFLLQKVKERAARGSTFTGLDISPKLVGIARMNNPGARIVEGDAEALPFQSSTFDVVFMTETLEHMQNFEKAISEAFRVLRQDGIFIVTVPNRDWASYDFYDKIRNHDLQPIDDHYFRFEEITSLLKGAGFEILKYKGLDNLFYYGFLHRFERLAALFIPYLQRRMKRIAFVCRKN